MHVVFGLCAIEMSSSDNDFVVLQSRRSLVHMTKDSIFHIRGQLCMQALSIDNTCRVAAAIVANRVSSQPDV